MTIPTIRCSIAPVRSGAADAELIVLGPSLGTTAQLWDATIRDLSAAHRVLSWDLPGHGHSPSASAPFTIAELADSVVALVDSVGGGAFHYVGVSLGGAVGLELALRHPERLLTLGVFCSGARIGEPDQWRARAAQVRASGTPSVVASSAERWFAPGFLERDGAAGAVELSRLRDVDDESYALCCQALADYDVTDALGSITTPVLCVAGEQDVATEPDRLRELADGVPGASFEVIPGVAHLPMIERPDDVADLVLAHALGRRRAERTRDDARAVGTRVRREVLGDAHVDDAAAAITEETADFQDFITRYAWGEIWARPVLDRRARSLLTLACLVTGGNHAEIAMHVRAAVTNGLTRAEISEALLHMAIYAGVPPVNSAFAIARAVFAELDEQTQSGGPTS